MGKAVLLVTLAAEPHGGVLSVSPDQARSGGHMKAAGPMFSDGPLPMAVAARGRAKTESSGNPTISMQKTRKTGKETRWMLLKQARCRRIKKSAIYKNGRERVANTLAPVECDCMTWRRVALPSFMFCAPLHP